MEFFHNLTKQHQVSNMSAKTNQQNALNLKSKSSNLDLEKTIKKQSSEDTDSEVFKPIHTLISLNDCIRSAKKPQTLKDFK